jgi:hypothetical protein
MGRKTYPNVTLVRENAVEVILKLNPVLFGAGISLLSRRIDTTQLQLTSHQVYDNGVLLLQ